MLTPSSTSRAQVLKRLKAFSNLLDRAIPIPGTPYRFGLDPILGLLPGGGDCLGAVFSAYIIWEAAKAGAPNAEIGKMTFNVLFETLLGVVPVLGDLVDVAWKANVKNVELLEAHLDSIADAPSSEVLRDAAPAATPEIRAAQPSAQPIAPEPGSPSSQGVAVIAIAVIAAVTILALVGTLAIVRLLWTAFTGG
ncbi:MAG: DUF4112 domain-containing protein [Coleofasciculaceae cyanobacterium RL_1_1]|nr:DUF4112 domain-containing protein [Coleofasciculaceae cyanobacterium RL_1_1]